MIDIYILDIENLYQCFGSGFLIGFFLTLIGSVILSVVDLFKNLIKESI